MAIGRTDSVREAEVAPGGDAVAAGPVRTRRWRSDRYNEILRGFGLLAGALPTVIGLIAAARINWSLNGFSSPPVRVAGMTFTPWIAVATVVGGLLALSAAAAPTREPKLGLGALYVCGGLSVMIAQPTIDHVTLIYRFGVMTFLVGFVLVATGALMRPASTVADEDTR